MSLYATTPFEQPDYRVNRVHRYKLIARAQQGLRRIGCYHFPSNTSGGYDVKFTLTLSNKPRVLNFTIQKADLPKDYEYLDFLVCKPILQDKIGMEIGEIEDGGQNIIIKLILSGFTDMENSLLEYVRRH